MSPANCPWVFQSFRSWLLSFRLHTPTQSTAVSVNLGALHTGVCRSVAIIPHQKGKRRECFDIFWSFYYRYRNYESNINVHLFLFFVFIYLYLSFPPASPLCSMERKQRCLLSSANLNIHVKVLLIAKIRTEKSISQWIINQRHSIIWNTMVLWCIFKISYPSHSKIFLLLRFFNP